MKIVEPSIEVLTPINHDEIIMAIERAARTCYKSESKITPESGVKMVKSLISSGHMAMLEHYSLSVKFVCDRGVSHEIVRHRVASYAQESTRYCNYAKEQFGNEITVIRPFFFSEGSKEYLEWFMACESCQNAYNALIECGRSPQEARSVLPNSLKTEIVVTMNLREWIHFFNLRVLGTTGKPHPQMKQVAALALKVFGTKLPEIFGDQLDAYLKEAA